MPYKPRKARPDHTVHLTFPITGKLKNELIDDARKNGQSLQKRVNEILANHIRQNINKPPVINTPPPNPIQPLIDYLTGAQTLTPCGKTTCDMKPYELNGNIYCDTCGIRVQ